MSEREPGEGVWGYEKRLKREEAIKVFEKGGLLVIKPLSAEACSLYGMRTKWCVSGKQAARNWSNYTAKNVCFYIIINKNLDKKDKLYKVLVEVGENEIIWWDALDNEIEKPYFVE